MEPEQLKQMFSLAVRECSTLIRNAMIECNRNTGGDVEQVFKQSAARMASVYRDCAMIWDVVSKTFNNEQSSIPNWLIDETVHLLNAVDSGGVPFCVTTNLRRIAEGWGVRTTDKNANQIIEEIRFCWSKV